MNVKEEQIKNILESHKKIAVYGLSPDPTKASHAIPLYMQNQGWDMVGTYPKIHNVSGFKIYKELSEVPSEYLKMVNVFRSSERVPEVVEEVLKLGKTEVLWLQLGISHPEAEAKAEKAGLLVISNRCLKIEHKHWFNHA